MTNYYDKTGKPIEMLEWAELFSKWTYQLVARTTVGDSLVSTVWLGLDHNWGDGKPLIFETMVFGGKNDQYQMRYHTLQEAIIGHNMIAGAIEGDYEI